MSEYNESYSTRLDEPEKIDLKKFLPDIRRGIKKLWWVVIGLAVLFAFQSYFSVSSSYQPEYVAEATMSVKTTGNAGSYINAQTAQQLEKVFPYILTSGVLQDVIAEDMGLDAVPGTISASAEEGTNLFTLSATASDPQVAYDLLQSVIKNYPQVAEFVIGKTQLEILDETGIPEDIQKEQVIRGSYKRGALKGALLGLLLMCIYILTRHTVKSRKELRRYINLEDFGSLPYVRAKKRRKDKFFSSLSLMNGRVPQVYLEAIRKVCIKVTKEMEQKKYKTLLVTSSVSGEGKTTLAVNLAITAAKRGQNVILVDCDIRNPSVAGAMNDKGKYPGLSAVLRGKKELESALTTVKMENGSLRILYGGKPNDKNSSLLGTKAMAELIENLKEKADIVILDTAPSDILADAAALAKFVDAACYVVKQDYTRIREIRAGVQFLAMSGVDILGYIFNGDTSVRSRGYGYNYGYKRYGGYGYYHKPKRKQSKDKYGRVIKE